MITTALKEHSLSRRLSPCGNSSADSSKRRTGKNTASERILVGGGPSVTMCNQKAECEPESPPVFDGLAAADGRLYLPTIDGRGVCLGGGG